jgi:hypothetical protein
VFQQIGKLMLVLGIIVAGAGAIFYALGRVGIGKLPGDFSFGGRNWRVYVPIATCILLSIPLTAIVSLVIHLRR